MIVISCLEGSLRPVQALRRAGDVESCCVNHREVPEAKVCGVVCLRTRTSNLGVRW